MENNNQTKPFDPVVDPLQRKAFVAGQEIILDSSRLNFNEDTLPIFMQNLAKYYDYFGHYLALAEYIASNAKDKYGRIFGVKFGEYKADKASDKTAESRAENDPEVIQAKEALRAAEYNVTALKQHLRAWDRAHDNAQNRGHTLRKEYEKLNISDSLPND